MFRVLMTKPKGTTGATKMKIMAIIHHACENGEEAYGYNIWQCLKEYFHTYINDCDVRNVYSHLKDLCDLKFLERKDNISFEMNTRCLYNITDIGQKLEYRYSPYLQILRQAIGI